MASLLFAVVVFVMLLSLCSSGLLCRQKIFSFVAVGSLFSSLPAFSQARYEYAPYEALQKGRPCVVTFSPQTLDVCGRQIEPQDVRGWYVYNGVFAIYDQNLSVVPVEFLYEPALRSFGVHLEIWSGKKPAQY